MIILADLAERAGLTVAAVSMALRNHPRIGKETRARVQALAREAGYVVHPVLSRRGSRRVRHPRPAMALGLLREHNPAYPAFGRSYRESLETAARALGYRVEEIVHDPRMSPERLGEVLYHRGIEAVVTGPVYEKALIERFPWSLFSLVAYEAGHYIPPCHLVMPDIASTILDAVDRSLDHGYQRLLLAQVPEPVRPVDFADRYGAAALAEHRCEARGACLATGDFGPEDRSAFLDLLGSFRPQVVLGQTRLFYWWVREAGAVGRSVQAFLALRTNPEEPDPWIAGYREDHASLAELACRLLDGEVRAYRRGPPPQPARLLLPMPWEDGRTFGPPSTSRMEPPDRNAPAPKGSG